ncbi:MAG: hypothetical protein ACOY0T_14535 [Myxococcota bacterium]
MSLARRSIGSMLLLPIALLCLQTPLAAQPRVEDERAEVLRQLNESRLRVKKLEERLRLLDARRSQSAAVPPQEQIASNCSIPFFLDQDGVKHFRPECLLADNRNKDDRVSCELNPFTIDDEGIKRIRPACGGTPVVPQREPKAR